MQAMKCTHAPDTINLTGVNIYFCISSPLRITIYKTLASNLNPLHPSGVNFNPHILEAYKTSMVKGLRITTSTPFAL